MLPPLYTSFYRAPFAWLALEHDARQIYTTRWHPDKELPGITGLPLPKDWQKQLDHYFSTGTHPVLPINTDQLTGIKKQLLVYLKEIPGGQTMTYGTLAQKFYNRPAARAAGQMLRANPLPLLLPCHRVVPASYTGHPASSGGYCGTDTRLVAIKNMLLFHEQAEKK